MDGISYADPETINGLNLYAYCGNNPVMRTDSLGTNWWTDFWNGVAGKIVGTVLVVAVVTVLSIATAGIGTALTGALGGGLIASIVGGAIGGAVSGAIFGAGVSLVSQGITSGYGNVDLQQVGKDTLVGATSGAIVGGILGGVKHLLSASKIANGLSGLKKAEENFNKAAQILKDTPMAVKNGVMTTERVAAQLSYNTASATLGFAQSANNIIQFTVTQIYRLIQFGVKQIIGGQIKKML